jgi:predicted TIM-barrel fold metal-dependent hydrolase
MHGYRPDRALEWLRPAMKKCAELGVVVLIHTGDGPYTIPTMFYPIIREFPMVNFIIGHFGIQTGGNYSFESFWMAMDTPNVYCESGWCFQSRIVEFAQQLPKNKIVFGTDSPPNDPGMWLRELEVLCKDPPHGINLSEDDLEGYLGNNIAKLVGIDPSPPPRDLKDAQARLTDSYAGVDRATGKHLLQPA